AAKWAAGKAGIVVVDGEATALRPAREGETTLTAAVEGKTAQVPVRVSGMTAPRPVSFVNDVMPAVTRAGCNQAACHGAQSGKGGFKLSLFGYDPPFDYAAIQGSDSHPRVSRSAPEESL